MPSYQYRNSHRVDKMILSPPYLHNRPISQIRECIRQISHNAPLCNRNVHACAHFCHIMMHCGIWDWCFVRYVQVLNRRVSLMRVLLVACRELVVDYNTLREVLYVFEHKIYISIHAPYTRIVVFWHISNIPQWFCRVKFVIIPPPFVQ